MGRNRGWDKQESAWWQTRLTGSCKCKRKIIETALHSGAILARLTRHHADPDLCRLEAIEEAVDIASEEQGVGAVFGADQKFVSEPGKGESDGFGRELGSLRR